jgi:hypothetical protein
METLKLFSEVLPIIKTRLEKLQGMKAAEKKKFNLETLFCILFVHKLAHRNYGSCKIRSKVSMRYKVRGLNSSVKPKRDCIHNTSK